MSAHVQTWLAGRSSSLFEAAIEKLAATEDVVKIAVMPDAHVAEDVCVGTVTATRRTLLPAAVGGDIGCGMVAIRFEGSADLLDDRDVAAAILRGLYERVPPMLQRSEQASLPDELCAMPLSAPPLDTARRRSGRLEFGTLGRGNHFLELQRDEEGWLWMMVHSGSRAMGPSIRHHHEATAKRDPSGLAVIDAESPEGERYLADAAFAAQYARSSREHMLEAAASLVEETLGIARDPGSIIACDHNHVRREEHGGELLWVHRKGAMFMGEGVPGVLPGSMGSPSYHVEGRGNPEALCSAAHGAGRSMSRADARRRISTRAFEREVASVWFDRRIANKLREEAPSAYKDIGEVMKAQRDLVKVTRRVTPVLAYKAT